MLFGCPLPEELDGAGLGQCAVSQAFEALLKSAAEKHPRTLYREICDAYEKHDNDTTLVTYLIMYLHAMFAHVTIA